MSMRKRKKVQILSREELRLRRWDFRLVPSERGLEAVGKSVHLHIISRDNHIDLFPHTSAVEKIAILRSKKPLIYSRERTAQSGGLLTSIWSNRAMLRRSVCCQEKINKDWKVAYFRAFCKVSIIREALRKARFSCMETYLLQNVCQVVTSD